MPTNYIAAAMRRAHYELLPEGEGFYGHIPALPGVWANAGSLEDTHAELREALEGWIALALTLHNLIPAIGGVEVTIARVA